MENLKWIRAMSERLIDAISNEIDDETKDLIIRAFMQGLYQQPAIVEELKSSSLIESDYFDDED
jgi:predicted transcriptional regulator